VVYFNFGRYSQNPLYNNVYTNTGNGTVAGDEGGICDETAVIPGTDMCYPVMTYAYGSGLQIVGNPSLLIEKTTSYELGFAAELGGNYALQVSAFSKDQFGLTGMRRGGQGTDGARYFDMGSTYGNSVYAYWVLVNQDFQTVRGFELSLRRRLFDYWGFNLNFGLTQAMTNAAAPDLEVQNREDGDPQNLAEIRSEVDLPASFNASVFFRVGNERPFGNSLLDAIVRNAGATITVSARSGFPYTPTLTYTGIGVDAQLERNSGRAPGVMQVNLQADKNFWVSNLQAGAFVRVSNLLDQVNCQQVFPTTGTCDGGAVDQDRARNGNRSAEAFSSTHYDRASYYGPRRSINFGARVSF
jgi:outer membrane receptor protein involved in Fe transport